MKSHSNHVCPGMLGRGAAIPFVALVSGLLGCGGSTGPKPPLSPAISSFSATPGTITSGQATTLRWSVSFADTVTVSDGVGAVNGSSVQVSPLTSTTYTLTAANASGAITANASVTVVAAPRAPVISTRANVTAGASGIAATVPAQDGNTFLWTIAGGVFGSGATSASGTAVTYSAPAVGVVSLSCTAMNGAGTVSQAGTASVNVVPPPGIASFVPDRSAVTAGRATRLTAVFTGGTGAIDQGIGAVASDVPASTAILTTEVTFTLSVTNAAGDAVTAKTTVAVVPAPVIASFQTAAQTPILAGSATTLTAVFTGGTGVVDHFVGEISSGVAASTGPVTATTTFTLVVMNPAGDSIAASAAPVVVQEPGTFLPTAVETVASPRVQHTATELQSGKVLFAGGDIGGGFAGSTAELYDFNQGQFSSTGNLVAARFAHAATLLPNGTVLLAGGLANANTSLASAELYDPATGTFSATGSMGTARSFATATLLADGSVLLAGGNSGTAAGDMALATAELFDPSTGSFTPTGSMGSARHSHIAMLLDNGLVLIAGGLGPAQAGPAFLDGAELYDPSTGTFAPTSALSFKRAHASATRLVNGTVLVAGGDDGTGFPAVAELYDRFAGAFTLVGPLNVPRAEHTATLLFDGRVLIAGGANDTGNLTSAE
ncbi:MAG: kelch repeat-containing protein, partial [Myxococcales bacterium]